MGKQGVTEQKKGTSSAVNQKKSNSQKGRLSSFKDDYELPQSYNETNVNLISRSPSSMHVYWDVSKSALSKVKKQLGRSFSNAKYYLRVYETTLKSFDGNNANDSFDVNVNLNDRNSYIDLPKDNACYCADLGFKSKSGEFNSIARSNFITAQRRGPANNPTLNWISVDNDDPSQIVVTPNRGYQKYSRIYQRYSQQKQFSLYGGRIPLTVEEIWSYYSKLTPLLGKLHKKKANEYLLKPEKEDAIYDSLYEKRNREEEFNRNILIQNNGLQKYSVGASEELVKEFNSSDSNQSPLDSSASEGNIPNKGRNFFFELNTELIVYGRTEPDATVMHGDKEVTLNPDGTFSLRFLLPDGKIPLDFTAQSFDKVETRRINTAVERYKTMYVPV